MTVKICFRMSLTVSLFLLATVSVSQAQYSGGSGTADDPYQIATAADLIALGETPDDYDKHFILTADIDLDPNLPGGKVFTKAIIAPYPVQPFEGVFDGNNYKVSHLTIRGETCVGLFGRLDAGAVITSLRLEVADVNGGVYGGVGCLAGYSKGSIRNCHSTDSFVRGGPSVGGLIGTNLGSVVESWTEVVVVGGTSVGGLVGINGGRIFNCGATCTISYAPLDITFPTGDFGGLVGRNLARTAFFGGIEEGGSIVASFSTVSVTGLSEVGGLVGSNGGSVSSCYSSGLVTGYYGGVGGLVGRNSDCFRTFSGSCCVDGKISSSYSTSMVNRIFEPIETGGLVGHGGELSFVDVSFWDKEVSEQTESSGGTGLTTAEMQTANTFLNAGWDFVGETENGPNDVWKIVEGQTYPLLSWQKYGGGTGEPNDPYLIYTAEHLNALGAEPNDYDKHFRLMADIDLSGYTYDRAVIAPDTNDLPDRSGRAGFDGAAFTGVFDGNGHTISHLVIDGVSYLGLFGEVFGGEISDLGLELVNVSGTRGYIGGLVGSIHGRTITRSYCTGTIAGGYVVGGLAGENHADITMSYSAALVTGNDCVGGLVGYDLIGVSNSYATGSVTGMWAVGGLIGNYGYDPGDPAELAADVLSPYHCYSTGMISGEAGVGGLIGISGRLAGWPASCFWDMETSLQDTSGGYEWSGREALEEVGLSTAEMQTARTFIEAGWDFIGETENGTDDIWWILEGQDYPRLWWELENQEVDQ